MSRYDDEDVNDFAEVADNDDDVTCVVIRLTPMRIGMTLLLVLIFVYMLLTQNWLGAGITWVTTFYQWKYYRTYDDAIQLTYFIYRQAASALQALHADQRGLLKQIRELKGDTDGSDAQ